MAQKNLYKATISYEGSTDILDVDMTNLPYDMFGPDFPLEIQGDVDMGKCKGQPLPDMTNVIINGAFDCSTCTLTNDSVLPRGITSLVCKHSISSLDTLIEKIPDTVTTVVVRSAILTAVKDALKKNAADKSAYDSALSFIELYPNITVTDGKKTLRDVIDSCAEKAPEKPIKKPANVKKETLPEQQTEEWLSSDEMVAACMSLSENIGALTSTEVARYVQMARSPKAKLGIKTQKMIRKDGEIITCIHKSETATVVQFIESKITKEQTQQNLQPNKTKAKETKTVQPVAQQTLYVGTKEIKPVKIKKYITKAVWSKIKCENVKILLRVLKEIEAINVRPTDTKGINVLYVEDNQVKTSTIDFKNSNYLAQGFGPSYDNPRMIWTIYGDTLICQHFLKTHMDPKSNSKYKQIIRNKPVDLSEVDFDDLLNVTDLIKELDDGHTPPPAGPTTDKKTTPVDTVKTEETIDTESGTETLSSSSTTNSDTVEPVANATPDNTVNYATQKKATEPPVRTIRATTSRKHTWEQLYSMHAEFHITIDKINLRQKEIAEALLIEETETSLQLTDELQQLLKQKLAYEEALKKFREAAMYMQEIQQQFKAK